MRSLILRGGVPGWALVCGVDVPLAARWELPPPTPLAAGGEVPSDQERSPGMRGEYALEYGLGA